MQPVAFFKALADETRLKCLLLIQREGELCVCELMARRCLRVSLRSLAPLSPVEKGWIVGR